MTCQEFQDLLSQYVLGTLDAPEEQALRTHLHSGCPECNQALRDVAASLAALAMSLPEGQVSPRPLQQLLARAQGLQAAQKPAVETFVMQSGATHPIAPATHPTESTPWTINLPRLRRGIAAAIFGAIGAAILAVGAGVGAGVTYRSLHGRVDQLSRDLRRVNARLAAEEHDRTAHDAAMQAGFQTQIHASQRDLRRSILELQASQRQVAEVVDLIGSPQSQSIALAGTPQQPSAAGRVIWDPATGKGHLLVSGLKPLADGKVFELWLLDSQKHPYPAGTFEPDATGDATVSFTVKGLSSRAAAAAVTNEPSGGKPAPTGQFQLTAAIAS